MQTVNIVLLVVFILYDIVVKVMKFRVTVLYFSHARNMKVQAYHGSMGPNQHLLLIQPHPCKGMETKKCQ